MDIAAYAGLFFATFLAATIVPLSSEAMLSGMIVGGFNPITSLIVATIGNFIGGMSSYWLGYLGKEEWISKYLRISNSKIEKIKKRIDGKEHYMSFFCWLPIIGDVIAVVLGVMKLRIRNVAIGMFIGKALRYIVWSYFTFWVANI